MTAGAVVLFLGRGGEASFRLLLGRPAAAFALEAACGIGPEAVLIIPGGTLRSGTGWAELVPARAKAPILFFDDVARKIKDRAAEDIAPLRTARALLERYPGRDIIAVASDLPLLRPETLRALLREHRSRGLSLTFLSRGGGEGMSGVFAFRSADIFPLLRGAMGFGDLAARLTKAGKKVGFVEARAAEDLVRAQGQAGWAWAAARLRGRKIAGLVRRGVIIHDPISVWIDWDAEVGRGASLSPGVVIEGRSRIGPEARISPHVHIMDSRIGRRVRVLASTVIEQSVVEEDAQVGPFSRLRPGTRVRAGAKVGNFVEMKNTDFGRRSKAQHLSYLGDSRVGEDVNIGAGTITCNYDGFKKSPTEIGPGAFIGSGTELVAPVKIGRGAYIAAGSTITKDVPAGALAVARARQVEKPGWALERLKRSKKRQASAGEGRP